MSSMIRDGNTFHGTSVRLWTRRLGVFTDEYGNSFAGQHKDGYACGLGLLTRSFGTKEYAEYGPDGQYDGRCLDHSVNGHTAYELYERGESKGYARVDADGRCTYNYVDCAPDDPRLLALIAQVAPVEVRPRSPRPSPAIGPHSPPSDRPMRRLVLHPQALAAAMATEVHPPRCTPLLLAVRRNPTAAALQCATTQ
jgi:hypothetical protein